MQVARVIRLSERGNDARAIDYVVVTGSRASGPPPPPPPAYSPPPVAVGEMERTVTVWVDFALIK